MLILLDDKSDKTNWEVKISPENSQAVRDLNLWPLWYQLGAGHYVGSKETREVMNRWLYILLYIKIVSFFQALFSLLSAYRANRFYI